MITSSRRGFIKRSSLAGASLALPGALRGEDPARSVRSVSIFHTTDLHGHIRPTSTYDGIGNVGGLARCAAQIREWRKALPHSLLVDIGDVYQGTAVGWMTRGRLMIDLFNKLGYDAWVLGNHEFDWGPEVVLDAVSRSRMPILTGNILLEGKQAGTWDDATHPLAKVLPHIVKEVGGFRIGMIGLVTPGLPYWLRPELLSGFEATDPREALEASVRYLREEAKVDAVVACGHFGWRDEDDFANPINAVLAGDNGVDVYLAGHTHRDHSSMSIDGTLYTQANYFGIHCGRVDLTFDVESRRLVQRRAFTVFMDERIEEDPLVLEAARDDLDESGRYLATEVGEIDGELSDRRNDDGGGSPLQNLLCAAFVHAAAKKEIAADGVFHGTFGSGTLKAGSKTVADMWDILPYENRLVALYLTRAELAAVMDESLDVRSDRALYGFEVISASAGAARYESRGERFVTAVRPRNGVEKPEDHRYCIIFNSYDAQSGGKRLMRLRALAERPEARATLLPMTSREALIDFFKDKGVVRPADVREPA
ncbi:MAG: bifunctional metallophosphatase/5'-nucleotidase [Akkermansiaceae bacterium]|nr:bifunctional metallophosphatase/5'-nucleotidase [Akkermansiaceae bacterium]NNM30758.1 bifunctional metallophosphatase/5'-nucleotidase [Akkermansiaceae bacterium]